MDLAEAQQILRQVDTPVTTAAWSKQLTTAVQRALAELYVLSPYDDVDGEVGPRTRAAWRFFKEATSIVGPKTLDQASARRLVEASKDPAKLIGQPKVDLQPDFEFRRSERPANRERSVSAIIREAEAQDLTRAQIAYVLATAEHESASFGTLEEFASGTMFEGREDLGNTQPGDGPRFKGRGYVQLTGRLNYTAYANRSGIQVVQLPVILMNWPALSVWVLVDGMRRGAYTGHRLDKFVNKTKQDFINARRVVNGLDRAEKIAKLATQWLAQLE
jgi:hypothetical protein